MTSDGGNSSSKSLVSKLTDISEWTNDVVSFMKIRLYFEDIERLIKLENGLAISFSKEITRVHKFLELAVKE